MLVPRRLARLADVAAARADEPEHRNAALHTLAWPRRASPSISTLLDKAAADDVDLAWRVLVRRASLGRYDESAAEELRRRDPDPDTHLRAWGAEAARPTEAAKAEAWERVWRDRAVPPGTTLVDFARCFWRPVQHELLVPWAHRYLDEVGRGCPAAACSRCGSMVRPHATEATCDPGVARSDAQDVADADGADTCRSATELADRGRRCMHVAPDLR